MTKIDSLDHILLWDSLDTVSNGTINVTVNPTSYTYYLNGVILVTSSYERTSHWKLTVNNRSWVCFYRIKLPNATRQSSNKNSKHKRGRNNGLRRHPTIPCHFPTPLHHSFLLIVKRRPYFSWQPHGLIYTYK